MADRGSTDTGGNKKQAKATAEEREAAEACSKGTMKAFEEYVKPTKEELAKLPNGSRKW